MRLVVVGEPDREDEPLADVLVLSLSSLLLSFDVVLAVCDADCEAVRDAVVDCAATC